MDRQPCDVGANEQFLGPQAESFTLAQKALFFRVGHMTDRIVPNTPFTLHDKTPQTRHPNTAQQTNQGHPRATRTCATRPPRGGSRGVGSFHTSIENLVGPNNDNNIQIKYPDNINNQKYVRFEHKMTSQHSEHYTEMPKRLILRTTLGMTHVTRKEKQKKVTDSSTSRLEKLHGLQFI